jgi:hypothetical protein
MLPQEVLQNIWGENGRKKGCYVLSPSKDRWARCYSGKLPLASVELKLGNKLAKQYLDPNISV